MNNLTEQDSRSTVNDQAMPLTPYRMSYLIDLRAGQSGQFAHLWTFNVDPVSSHAKPSVCDHGRTWDCVKCQLIEWSKGVA